MPYNIDTWKTKKLVNLRVPIASFFKSERKDWHPDREDNIDTMTTILTCCESSEIEGKISEGLFNITKISIRGECSGTFWNEVLIPALKDSMGELEATQVWEGGDSITRLTVKDGIVAKEDVDI